MDEEYEGPDDDDRPRKHMETTIAIEENPQEIFTEERSSAPPPPYGPVNQPKSKAKTVFPIRNPPGKTKAPVQLSAVTKKPAPPI